MNKKIKVLCFTDDAIGRDVEMMLPIRYFAERFLNCEFYHALNIDIHEIYRQRPDLILQANTIGSNLYFEISKIAHEQNIPLFALISEEISGRMEVLITGVSTAIKNSIKNTFAAGATAPPSF